MLRTFYLRASEADGRVLGSDVVINGLQDYLREHKMSTASPSDLWRVMRETSGNYTSHKFQMIRLSHTLEHSHRSSNTSLFSNCKILR